MTDVFDHIENANWSAIPGELVASAVDEYRRRTWWGRAFYPIWLFENLLLVILITLFAVVFGFPLAVSWMFDKAKAAWKRNTPATYKD